MVPIGIYLHEVTIQQVPCQQGRVEVIWIASEMNGCGDQRMAGPPQVVSTKNGMCNSPPRASVDGGTLPKGVLVEGAT